MNINKNQSDAKETPDRIRKNEGFSKRPINKHGDYDGTDVGFTSTSIQDPKPNTNLSKNRRRVLAQSINMAIMMVRMSVLPSAHLLIQQLKIGTNLLNPLLA